MRAHGLSVRGFSDAWTFLEAVDEQSRGCVVLDVRMPGLSGLGLQKALNARGVELPVIIVTGHGDAETAITAMKHGAVDFLCKPFRGRNCSGRCVRRWTRTRNGGRASGAGC